MSQTKALYLVLAAGQLRMSELAARLRPDVLVRDGRRRWARVPHGLLTRHEDPADRRQVVINATAEAEATLESFRELNSRRMREMLAHVDGYGPRCRRASPSHPRCRRRRRLSNPPPSTRRGITPVKFRSFSAGSQPAQRHAAAGRRAVHGRIVGLGILKQELLPDVDSRSSRSSRRTPARVRPTSRAGRRADRGAVAGGHLAEMQSTSANSIALVVAQFEFGTDVDAAQAEIEENIAAPGCPIRSNRRSGAQHQRLAGDHRVSRDQRGRPGGRGRDRPKRSCPRSTPSGRLAADLTGGLESRLITVDPTAGRGRRSPAAAARRPRPTT